MYFRFISDPSCLETDEYCRYSTEEEIADTAERYSSLFLNGRKEVMMALSCLPEFGSSEELQLKTIFTVIIVSFMIIQFNEMILFILHHG